MEISLINLDPHFLKIIDDTHYRMLEGVVGSGIQEVDGISFLCPLCYFNNRGPIGTHSIWCWKPKVPQTFFPIPGRWDIVGNDFNDLSLIAGRSSVKLGDGSNIMSADKCCNAHFTIVNGKCLW